MIRLLAIAIAILGCCVPDTSQSAAWGISVQELPGFDCTGKTDSSRALQVSIDATPDGTVFRFPTFDSCPDIRFDNQIVIAERMGLQFISPDDGRARAPRIHWNGRATSAFSVQSSENVRFQGFTFQCNNNASLTKWIDFDGDPTRSHIGTQGQVFYSAFQPCAALDRDYKAISISDTARSNQENYDVEYNSFQCNSNISLRTRAASISTGSDILTAPGASFTERDIGQRVRVTYAPSGTWNTGILDTTIRRVIDRDHVVMSASASTSKTNATVHTGGAYGVGVYVGPSMNSKHHRIYYTQSAFCEYAIRVRGGSADVRHVGGGYGDVGVAFEPDIVETSGIEYYESEQDLVGIRSNAAAVVNIKNARLSQANQLANGFFQLDSMVLLEGSMLQLATENCNDLPLNGVVVSFGGNTQLTSIANNWRGCTWEAIGYNALNTFATPATTIMDNFDTATAARTNFGCFANNKPTTTCVKITGLFGHVNGIGLSSTVNNLWNDPNYAYTAIEGTASGSPNRLIGVSTVPSIEMPEPTTVSRLPSCDSTRANTSRSVTDAAAPTYNGLLTGGGASMVPAYCDGSNWRSH
jgi:hypothetical protein